MPPGRPSRESIYKQLEYAVHDLRSVGGLPLPAEAEGIWEGIWFEETHHSTAIEGNTLIQRQVQMLLEEGRAVGSKDLSDYMEVQSYGEAAHWVYTQAHRADRLWEDEEEMLHETELRETHVRVVETVWKHYPPEQLLDGEGPGAYRRHDIRALASGVTPPQWTDVPPQVRGWIAAANQDPPEDVPFVEHLASLHAAFERIHPFRDGNGRVGRLILNLMLVRHGYPPVIIYKRDRNRYLRALARADRGDDGPLGELLARSVTDSIHRFLLPGLAGPHKVVPLKALADEELSYNALLTAAKRNRLRVLRRADQYGSTRQWVDEYKASRRRGKVTNR